MCVKQLINLNYKHHPYHIPTYIISFDTQIDITVVSIYNNIMILKAHLKINRVSYQKTEIYVKISEWFR